MAAHSSILAWEIPWTGEPGGLQSVGLQKSQTPLSNFQFHFLLPVVMCRLDIAHSPWKTQCIRKPWGVQQVQACQGNLENLLSMIQVSEGEEKSRFLSSVCDTFLSFFF